MTTFPLVVPYPYGNSWLSEVASLAMLYSAHLTLSVTWLTTLYPVNNILLILSVQAAHVISVSWLHPDSFFFFFIRFYLFI